MNLKQLLLAVAVVAILLGIFRQPLGRVFHGDLYEPAARACDEFFTPSRAVFEWLGWAEPRPTFYTVVIDGEEFERTTPGGEPTLAIFFGCVFTVVWIVLSAIVFFVFTAAWWDKFGDKPPKSYP